jgi:putative tryptophan/tyrosine transport system substrate-binding protein
MVHGPDPLDLIRRASSYVDRILRRAKPSELPVQYPTKFGLVVISRPGKGNRGNYPRNLPRACGALVLV